MNKATLMIITAYAYINISCEHKDLCYNHPHAPQKHFVFDWNESKAAPKTMMLFVYNNFSGTGTQYEFAGREGGTIRLSAGNYSFLCFNSDSYNSTYYNTESHGNFTFSTKTTQLGSRINKQESLYNPARADDERIALAPDMIWSHSLANKDLTEEDEIITMFPDTSVCMYTVTIKKINNLSNITTLNASISSMTGGYLIGSKKKNNESVTIPFTLNISKSKASAYGIFNTFGDNTSNSKRHIITIFSVLEDKSKWNYQYDVTEQIHSAPNEKHVNILLEDLTLPSIIEEGSGLKPNVEEWIPININIDM